MIEQFLIVCWNNAIAVTVLAVVVLAVTSLLRYAPLAHLLWLVVLIKLITPPILSLPMTISVAGESGPDRYRQPTVVDVSAVPSDASVELANNDDGQFDKFGDSQLDNWRGRGSPAERASIVGTAHDRAASSMAAKPWWTWSLAAAVVWVAGTVSILASVLLKFHQFHRVVCHAATAPRALRDEVARLAELAGLRAVPDVRVSGARIVPLVIGFQSHTVLLLPQTLLSSLKEEERTTLLAHELAHLHRRDHWVSWITVLVVSLYWWHPVAWFSRRQLRRAADECCDGWVVKWFPDKTLSYAESMMKTVDFLADGAQRATTLASGFGQLRSLKRRLVMVIENRTSHRLRWPIRFASYAIAMVLLLISPLLVLTTGPRLTADDSASSPFGSLSAEEKFPWQPKQLINVFGTHRGKHWWEVYAVAWSPDGKWIATGSGDKRLRLWDARTLRERASVGLPGTVQSVVFAPDGKHLAAALNRMVTPGEFRGQIKMWELQNGQLKKLWSLNGIEGRIASLAFSPDGKTMAVGSREIHLLDVTGAEPRETHVLPVPGILWKIAISPDGTLLAGPCGDSLVLWNLSAPEPKERVRIATSALSVAFSPDGQTFASGTTFKENAIHIWNLRTQEPKEQAVLRNVGNAGVEALAFSPDGNVLASSTGYENAIRLWKMQSGQPEAFAILKGHSSKTFALAFAPDGKQLASASSDQSLRLWTIDGEPRESEVSRDAHDDLNDVCDLWFLPDRQSMVVLHSNSIVRDCAATVFQMADQRVRTRCKLSADEHYYFYSSRLAADGKTFATVQKRAKRIEPLVTGQSLASDDASVMLWDLATGKRMHTLSDRFGEVSALAFSADGRLFATASSDGKIRVWNVTTGKLIAEAPSRARKVLDLAFGGNGATLVSLNDALSPLSEPEAVIQMWHVRGADLSAGDRWETRGSETGTVGVISPDGNTLAVQRRGDGVEVWAFRESAFRQKITIGGTDPRSFASAVSSDGTMIAMNTRGDALSAVSVWDAASGKMISESLMPGDVRKLTFSPDKRHIATVNQNGTIYVLRIKDRGAAQNRVTNPEKGSRDNSE
ncbi:MAG TPA: M56 family metallopeptidase [Planctomycetaceae bacterium]|jgi:WD40 repeat protein/beta-lactamase regulating signal transducer with metallopeptidase domain|nr:M56 family metallopeptidase [Planctomycetaceae bacterium]